MEIYERLYAYFGPQHWWPAESPFEVVVGAVLTQNTAWANVEKAIARLKAAGLLDPAALRTLPLDDLAEYIRCSGTYRVKARRLRALLEWLGDPWEARLAGNLDQARQGLLRVEGVGEETADAILLYAVGRPSFVIDAYTRRILDRVGIEPEERTYQGYRRLFMENISSDAALFNEYHALFVQLAKDYCRPTPKCDECPLREVCATGQTL